MEQVEMWWCWNFHVNWIYGFTKSQHEFLERHNSLALTDMCVVRCTTFSWKYFKATESRIEPFSMKQNKSINSICYWQYVEWMKINRKKWFRLVERFYWFWYWIPGKLKPNFNIYKLFGLVLITRSTLFSAKILFQNINLIYTENNSMNPFKFCFKSKK